ncbi:transcriptional regulator, TetR family [Amycolatopsis marina]|uniref:Transcriptional regulator, TetR family n=1 Tax=Amycolatopsis marina TaxID=490629 RepID=A0A1I1C256_9PSEU|nr:transcriptional regulator, TetR family [Amycolatopsis marina]
MVFAYRGFVPKLWSETIKAHRREVQDTILETASALVAERGLLSVTMSQIAEKAGIGRATLYKYFPDVEAIVLAWHERQVARHLEHLVEVRDHASDAGRRLEAVLDAYAVIHQRRVHHHRHEPYGNELSTFVHRDEHVAHAEHQVHQLITELLVDAVDAGNVRDDVPAAELASYCLHALAAAGNLRSKVDVQRLVAVVLSGLRPVR